MASNTGFPRVDMGLANSQGMFYKSSIERTGSEGLSKGGLHPP